MGVLEAKVALVTGGGRGLGEAISRTLADAGATVVIGDIDPQLGDTLRMELQDSGADAMSLPLDVGDARQAEDAVRTILDRFGRLDVLVNNAGTDVTLPITELAVEAWDRVLRTNLRGPFLLSRAAMPTMMRQRSGHIVNIVSTAARRAWANASAYHASKWGLLGFSHALHVEARKENVKVTAVIAGGMRTPFLLDRFPDIDPSTLQDPRNVAKVILHVLTQPDETVIPEVMVLPMRETSWP